MVFVLLKFQSFFHVFETLVCSLCFWNLFEQFRAFGCALCVLKVLSQQVQASSCALHAFGLCFGDSKFLGVHFVLLSLCFGNYKVLIFLYMFLSCFCHGFAPRFWSLSSDVLTSPSFLLLFVLLWFYLNKFKLPLMLLKSILSFLTSFPCSWGVYILFLFSTFMLFS